MADAVQVVDGRISVDLPYASLAILATARRDRVFYRIAGPDGADVTGYSGLAAAAGPATSHRPRFVDARYRDTPVRAVLLGRLVAEPGGPMATVVVAHSRDEREALAASILANAFGPILLLTLLAGALIWFAVRQALAPLGTIGRLVRDRAPTDLSPIAAPAPAEVRQLLAALNQFMARLQANLSLMQSFLGDAAHQMRTPLATLRAQADLAVEEADATAVRSLVRKIRRNAVLLGQVTNQLLSHAMVAPRSRPAGRGAVARGALRRRGAQRAEAGGRSPPLELDFRELDRAAVIEGDPVTLREAFTNLIDNAGRYAGLVEPVRIRIAVNRSEIEVDVADRGPGIPAAEKARVLERFARGSSGEGTLGSGLGLAIVKAVADAHRARLALLDRPGGGLLVRLAFPLPAAARRAAAAAALVAALLAVPAGATSSLYPASGAETARILIHAATDRPVMEPILRDFQASHPGIAIEYAELQSAEVYQSVVAPGAVPPDLAISSAMDLQAKLVNDGWTQPHVSAETSLVPGWANWRDEAYGFTLEPAVIVHALDGIAEREVPRSRPELVRLLQQQPERFRQRIATYDIAVSGLGYLFATQDSILSNQFWPLTLAMGGVSARLLPTSGAILDAVARGEVLIGYNVLGSYARARQQAGAAIGILEPRDYTLWMTRVVVIPRAARHPVLARSFVDHLLSARGQAAVAAVPGLRPIVRRDGDEGELPAPAASSAQPITLGPALLVFLDAHKRASFLADWSAAIGPP